jgi:DnaK suppressor protein
MKKTGKPAKKSGTNIKTTRKPSTKVKAAKKPGKPQKTAITKKPAAAGRLSAAQNRPASFSQRDLDDIRVKLNEMRISLSKNVEDKRTMDILEPEVGDSIDQATQSLDKEILFELSDNERKMLDNIDASLRKMDNGNYGVCEHCKRPVEKKRLKALPSARYCMSCQEGIERTRE